MNKVLFVCLGNICRSPVAEGIFLQANEQLQLGLTIDSAGTSSFHRGEAPDPRTITNALRHGVDLRDLRARPFEPGDFETFDVIYVMDRNNYQQVTAMAKSTLRKNKVKLFLSDVHGKPNLEVPDPYYGAEKDFELVFQLVYKAAQVWCTRQFGKSL